MAALSAAILLLDFFLAQVTAAINLHHKVSSNCAEAFKKARFAATLFLRLV